mmetsp:Transcript_7698/g.12514  ORF Transcript_7698/g.12514 Transcript_7698/m.12514 type:complete len:710 (+) Transcript_7698:1-2130(+)
MRTVRLLQSELLHEFVEEESRSLDLEYRGLRKHKEFLLLHGTRWETVPLVCSQGLNPDCGHLGRGTWLGQNAEAVHTYATKGPGPEHEDGTRLFAMFIVACIPNHNDGDAERSFGVWRMMSKSRMYPAYFVVYSAPLDVRTKQDFPSPRMNRSAHLLQQRLSLDSSPSVREDGNAGHSMTPRPASGSSFMNNGDDANPTNATSPRGPSAQTCKPTDLRDDAISTTSFRIPIRQSSKPIDHRCDAKPINLVSPRATGSSWDRRISSGKHTGAQSSQFVDHRIVRSTQSSRAAYVQTSKSTSVQPSTLLDYHERSHSRSCVDLRTTSKSAVPVHHHSHAAFPQLDLAVTDWQVRLDSGWVPFCPGVKFKDYLGVTQDLSYGKFWYRVVFHANGSTGTQTNLTTGKVRKLRRRKSEAPDNTSSQASFVSARDCGIAVETEFNIVHADRGTRSESRVENGGDCASLSELHLHIHTSDSSQPVLNSLAGKSVLLHGVVPIDASTHIEPSVDETTDHESAQPSSCVDGSSETPRSERHLVSESILDDIGESNPLKVSSSGPNEQPPHAECEVPDEIVTCCEDCDDAIQNTIVQNHGDYAEIKISSTLDDVLGGSAVGVYAMSQTEQLVSSTPDLACDGGSIIISDGFGDNNPSHKECQHPDSSLAAVDDVTFSALANACPPSISLSAASAKRGERNWMLQVFLSGLCGAHTRQIQ